MEGCFNIFYTFGCRYIVAGNFIIVLYIYYIMLNPIFFSGFVDTWLDYIKRAFNISVERNNQLYHGCRTIFYNCNYFLSTHYNHTDTYIL